VTSVWRVRVCSDDLVTSCTRGFGCYRTNNVRDESNGTESTFSHYSLAFLSALLCPRLDNGKERKGKESLWLEILYFRVGGLCIEKLNSLLCSAKRKLCSDSQRNCVCV